MPSTAAESSQGPEFSFRHLLELELHHFSPLACRESNRSGSSGRLRFKRSDVYDIVDQSVKEAKIAWSQVTATQNSRKLLSPSRLVLRRGSWMASAKLGPR